MHGPYFVNHGDPSVALVAPKPEITLQHPINAKALGIYCMDRTLALQDRDAVMGKTVLSMVVHTSPLLLLIEAKDTKAAWYPKYTDSLSLLFSMQTICSCYGSKNKHTEALLSYTEQHLERIEAVEANYYKSVDERNSALQGEWKTLLQQASTGTDPAIVLEAFAETLMRHTVAEIKDMEHRIHAMFDLKIPLEDVQSRPPVDIDPLVVLNTEEYAKMRKLGETAFGVKEMLCGSPEGQPQWFTGNGVDAVEYKNTVSFIRLKQYLKYCDVDNILK